MTVYTDVWDRALCKTLAEGAGVHIVIASKEIILKFLFAKLTVASVLACATALAFAEPGTSADDLLHDADGVVQQIDAGHFGEIWDDTAPFVKAKIPKDQWVLDTRTSRQSFGAVAARGWASVTRIRYAANASGIPAGLYANVNFTTALVQGGAVYELLSFRLENDGKWHLTGYVPRKSQDSAAQSAQVPKP
ncbi:DUF4019 domain-containing protein [Trinickia violacea]|uniref:DUF4019 domain-containing protein n=1 Tax=Trinickia violacea TaxID=2571746 RepID=A0A4V1EIP1_9BURK|nr:DUF4019 domain-containing protein [Trinickia violacea]QCP54450.1 DUF4019 domain-containing protein [Trinickia violacea]